MSAGASEFWRRVALPAAHPDAAHLTPTEDQRVAHMRAQGHDFDTIARAIIRKRLSWLGRKRRRA